MYLNYLLVLLCAFDAVTATASTSKTSYTLAYQNNLNYTDDANHVGFILLDTLTQDEAVASCRAIGESLVSSSLIDAHKDDFLKALSYNAYAGRALPIQHYHIENGLLEVVEGLGQMNFRSLLLNKLPFPAICTQSSNQSQPATAAATTNNKVAITSSRNTYIGFRNQKSFRFLGIRYADNPKRWTYSKPFSPTGRTLNATVYGPQCPQYGSGNEDCLFLNIQTPYIPKQGSAKHLRPVLFWIHGGGFVTGDSSDAQTDGGNLASREDIVTVTMNYRLGTLGFLAIPGTNITGNYGIADQINALEVSKSLHPSKQMLNNNSGQSRTSQISVAILIKSPSLATLRGQDL